MARLDSRSYAKRIVDTVDLFKKNDASKEDYVEYLADLLDDYVGEYLQRRIKKSGSPLGSLITLVNKGDYPTALLQLEDVTDPELAHLLKLLIEALTNGPVEDLQGQ